ncbi:thermostable celloxylanase [Paenibacillus sambharensis]|uniref:Beta-xylanase n=1 Tax=Paenibacillus sambharensis TaxID=1803190 RepID=A0A2W1LEK4_9BACL|nr:endo-1,4-beta-xylanase [Paenibacillus sambharensis]PZD97099.1 thermostable celloxylanase [Paenibacillus sambharensis]
MNQQRRRSAAAANVKLAGTLILAAILLWGCAGPADSGETPGTDTGEELDIVPGIETPSSSEPVPVPAEPSVQAEIPSLADTFVDYFPIGAAIEPFQTEGLKAELLKKHVNWLVAENVMKPDAIQPAEGVFNWTNADRIVAFAKANGMELRFHTLVWHTQVGDWFFKDAEGKPMADESDPEKREANKKLLLMRLDKHVRTIVDRYKGDITSWDVVNEVIEPGDPDGMRASDWYKITGTDYIATAFRAAREAGGPDIKLYINDYGTDDPKKRDLLYELVKGLLEQGVPIDGVGHQTHVDVHWPPVEAIIKSFRKFAELGLDNIVTELDMSIYAWDDRSDYGSDIPEDILTKQAERYGELFKAFRENKDILSGVVFWGIADDHSWLDGFPVKRTNAPLLFDRHYQAKPAFWSVVGEPAESG